VLTGIVAWNWLSAGESAGWSEELEKLSGSDDGTVPVTGIAGAAAANDAADGDCTVAAWSSVGPTIVALAGIVAWNWLSAGKGADWPEDLEKLSESDDGAVSVTGIAGAAAAAMNEAAGSDGMVATLSSVRPTTVVLVGIAVCDWPSASKGADWSDELEKLSGSDGGAASVTGIAGVAAAATNEATGSGETFAAWSYAGPTMVVLAGIAVCNRLSAGECAAEPAGVGAAETGGTGTSDCGGGATASGGKPAGADIGDTGTGRIENGAGVA